MLKGLPGTSGVISLVPESSDITLNWPWSISFLKDGVNYQSKMNNSTVFWFCGAPEENYDKKE